MKEETLKRISDKKDELIRHYEKIIAGIINRYGLDPEQPKAEKIKAELASLKAEAEGEKERRKYYDEYGEVLAGILVTYQGEQYTTGNRGHGLVELYQGYKFCKTVKQDEIRIVDPSKGE